jgi:hypothetical protein
MILIAPLKPKPWIQTHFSCEKSLIKLAKPKRFFFQLKRFERLLYLFILIFIYIFMYILKIIIGIDAIYYSLFTKFAKMTKYLDQNYQMIQG